MDQSDNVAMAALFVHGVVTQTHRKHWRQRTDVLGMLGLVSSRQPVDDAIDSGLDNEPAPQLGVEITGIMNATRNNFSRAVGSLTGRKLHLLVCACWRQVWYDIPPIERGSVEVVEDHVEKGRELPRKQRDAYVTAVREIPMAMRLGLSDQVAAGLMRDVVGDPFINGCWGSGVSTPHYDHDCFDFLRDDPIFSMAQAAYEERVGQCGTLDQGRLAVLHDAMLDRGCPVRVPCDFCGGCGTVIPASFTGKMARYEPHGDKQCPMCTDGAMPNPWLAHLTSGQTHVRGCWVIDAIMRSRPWTLAALAL